VAELADADRIVGPRLARWIDFAHTKRRKRR
jgi:hypothetical protein